MDFDGFRTFVGPDVLCLFLYERIQMQCHYDILGVSRDANDDELKKAYRKQALRYHPDKNIDNAEEAKKSFQLVQQAWEVLSDPQERAWYDKHRDVILSGGGENYEHSSIDIMHFFGSSAYTGYGDDEQGFYSVYRDVFITIAEEDKSYLDSDEIEEVPGFGDSSSPYKEVVEPFYDYWQSYCTAKSFVWMEKYDTREAFNRKEAKLMEKENKKQRDQARIEYNQKVRELVSFVRKRDRRVKAYKKLLEEKAAEKKKLLEEKREEERKKRSKEFESYKAPEWATVHNIEEELQNMDAYFSQEFGGTDDSSEGSEDDANSSPEDKDEEIYSPEGDNLYCVACDKLFKTPQALGNHENSKKHRENVELLKEQMNEEENSLFNHTNQNSDDDDDDDVAAKETVPKAKLSKKQKKKRKKQQAIDALYSQADSPQTGRDEEETGLDSHQNEETSLDSHQDLATNLQKESDISQISADDLQQTSNCTEQKPPKLKGKKAKDARKAAAAQESQIKQQQQKLLSEEADVAPQVCTVCGKEFSSRTRLFKHLNEAGHAALRTLPQQQPGRNKSRKKGKES